LPHYRIHFHCDKAPVGEAGKANLSKEVDRSIEKMQKRREAIATGPRPHPYAIVSTIFLFLAAFHWAFAAVAVVLGCVALFEINVKKKYGGRFLAVAALCGAVAIGGANLFLGSDGVQRLLGPDPVEQQCRENLKHIRAGMTLYKHKNEGRFPPNLGALYPDYVPAAANLACPGSELSEAGAGYSYAGPEAAGSGPEDVLVIDDGPENHRRSGALILFGDGRVERVSARAYEYLRLELEWLE